MKSKFLTFISSLFLATGITLAAIPALSGMVASAKANGVVDLACGVDQANGVYLFPVSGIYPVSGFVPASGVSIVACGGSLSSGIYPVSSASGVYVASSVFQANPSSVYAASGVIPASSVAAYYPISGISSAPASAVYPFNSVYVYPAASGVYPVYPVSGVYPASGVYVYQAIGGNPTGTHNASGSYTWTPGTSTFTLTTTTSDFVCDGPSVGSKTKTGVAITATTMTWPNDMTWTRLSGTPGDAVGTWTSTDSVTGNSFVLTLNLNGTASVVGNIVSCPSISGGGGSAAKAEAQHWSSGYLVQLRYSNPAMPASSVVVTGPGIAASGVALTYNPLMSSWGSGTPESIIQLGTTYPTGLPLTYTFNITPVSGTPVTTTSTVSCFEQQFVTNISPLGSVTGNPTFSWTGITDPSAVYGVQVNDSNGSWLWANYYIPGTSIVYNGPALTPGTTYSYVVSVQSSSACNNPTSGGGSHVAGSFTYAAGTAPSYAGTYSGTYSGSDAGTWTATVSSSGFVAATVNTGALGSIGGSGQVVLSTGALTITTSGTVAGVATFTGTINPTTGAVSGTWTGFTSMSGSFSGTPAPVAGYAGTYSGMFMGTDTGTWINTISASGVIAVTGYSNNLASAYTGSGQVLPGGSFTGATSTGSTFSGMINPATGVMSGTWVNATAGGSGSFSGNVALQPPAANTWTTKASMPTARQMPGATGLNGLLYVVGGYAGTSSLNTLEVYNPATNTWATKAPMSVARHQMAVGAINGLIYVAGGYNAGTQSTLEVYNPSTNTWMTKAPMPTALQSRGAVVNGILYVMGGESGGFCSSVVEAYNPVTDTWATKASMPTARCHIGVVADSNGLIYAIGGTNTSGSIEYANVEVYNPATDTWTTKAPMPTARRLLSADMVNGIIYAVGGNIANGIVSTAVEAYDPVANTWATKALMPTARNALSSGVVNGTLYAVGGVNSSGVTLSTNEAYTPGGTWTTKTPMPAARYGAAAGAVNGVLYVAGGVDVAGPDSALRAYTPATNSWSTLAPMPGGRYQGDGAAVINGQLYVAGGWTWTPPLPNNNLWVYDPPTNTWSAKASMPTLSACGSSGAIGGKLYVTTGCDGNSGWRNFLHVYDPATNTWSALTSSPDAHAGGAGGVINGKFYVAGGIGLNSVTSARLDVYDPTTNTWTTLAPMPTARQNAAATVFNGKLYVIGGYSAANTYLTTVEVYDPVTNTWVTETPMSTARQSAAADVVNGVIYAVGGSDATGALAVNEALSLPFTGGTGTGTHTASGTYTWNATAGVLTSNWVSSDFVCGGPNLGTQTKTGVTITTTTMIWPNDQMTWTRTNGVAGDGVGIWTATDSTTGNSYTLTVNANGTMSVSGNVVSCYSEWHGTGSSQDPVNPHWLNIGIDDPLGTIQSAVLTYTGAPGVSGLGTGVLASVPAGATGKMWRGFFDATNTSAGTFNYNTFPTLPITYTLTITDTSGAVSTRQVTYNGFNTNYASNISPSGNYTGTTSPTFTWTAPPNGSYSYVIEVAGLPRSSTSLYWSNNNLGSATSAAYTGPMPLPACSEISLFANDVNNNGSKAVSYLGYNLAAGQTCGPGGVVTSDITPPTIPAGLVATPTSSSQVNLSWTASTDNVGVTAYKVYRGGTLLATLGNVTSYNDTGLTASTTYSYTVAACDAAGNCSAQSTAISATTQAAADTQPPTIPAGLTATPASSSQVNLSWTASTDNVGVTGYKVFRNGTLVGSPSGISFNDTGLTASTTYSYTVAACDAAGNCSAQSGAVPATTPVSVASCTGAHTASGTYSWSVTTGVLTSNWASSDFVYGGPKLGTQTKTGVTITATTMIWPNDQMTWTRASGNAGDIVGTWTATDSTTGNSFTVTANTNGTMSVAGNVVSCYFAWHGTGSDLAGNHWLNIGIDDPLGTIQSAVLTYTGTAGVTGLGTGILGSAFGSSGGPALGKSWRSYFDATNASAGTFNGVFPTLPITYTLTITDTSNVVTAKQITYNGLNPNFVSNISPSGNYTGTTAPSFTWTAPPNGSYSYVIEMAGLPRTVGSFFWANYNVGGATSAAYTGAAPLPPCSEVSVYAADINSNQSVARAYLGNNLPAGQTCGPNGVTTGVPIASYAGNYSGSFSGGNSGTWVMTISTTGAISGASYVNGLLHATGTGQVSVDGSLTMAFGSTSQGGTFTGAINAATGAISGTWSNTVSNKSGTWTGSTATTANYAGAYSGTFSGGDSGTWAATISTTGAITVTANNQSGAISGSGQASPNGSLTMTVGSVSTGATFNGAINLATGAISGTWSNASNGKSGTFTGTSTSQFDGTYTGSWSVTCPLCNTTGDTAAGTFTATLVNGVFTNVMAPITSGTHGPLFNSGVVSSSGAITGTGANPSQCSNSPSTFTGQITGATMTMAYSRPASAGGCEAEYGTITATTAVGDTQPPTIPAGLAATSANATQVSLSWNASTDNVGVTVYKVYRGGTLLATLGNVTSYHDTGLTASTTYSYTVAACDAAGNCSMQSASISATTLAALTSPTGLTATTASSSQVNLSWTVSNYTIGVTYFEVRRNGTLVGSPSGTSFNDTGLAASTTYSYTVATCDAINWTNCSAQSTAISATTQAAADTQAPTIPAGLTATPASSSQVNLSWTASTDNVGVTAYKVYRGGALLATLGNVTSYNDTGLTASTTYSYTVAACDAAGNCSAQSGAVPATTQAAASGTTLNFVPGWNLVGNSVNAQMDVATTFGDTNKVITVWKWIPATSKWAFYTPSMSTMVLASYVMGKGYDFLTTINGGEGFWVNAKTAFTAQLPAGTVVTTSTFADQTTPPNNLPLGWSLIAIGDNKTPRSFVTAISATIPSAGTVPTSITTLWAWDSGSSGWYFYAPILVNNGGLASYISSKGYLDFGTKTLDPAMGFWVNHP